MQNPFLETGSLKGDIVKKFFLGTLILAASAPLYSNDAAGLVEYADNIEFIEQSCLRFVLEDRVIYTDPFQVKGKRNDADIIIITHNHRDHFSVDDILKLVRKDTVIILPFNPDENTQYSDKLKDIKSIIVPVGRNIDIDGINIKAVYAYNIVKKNHPKSEGFAGYVITGEGIVLYHSGDTERIPEMKELDVDIAFFPLGTKYTMNSVEEAAEAVLDVKAEVAIPVHYGLAEGTLEDAVKFKELLEDKVEVIIKKK